MIGSGDRTHLRGESSRLPLVTSALVVVGRMPGLATGSMVKPVTIDERLTRLTERLEMLTGQVEMITAGPAQLTDAVPKMRSIMDDLVRGFATVVELARSYEVRMGILNRAASMRQARDYYEFQIYPSRAVTPGLRRRSGLCEGIGGAA